MCQISMALFNTSVLTTMQYCLPDLPADKFTLRETPVITGKKIKDSALDAEIKDQIREKNHTSYGLIFPHTTALL